MTTTQTTAAAGQRASPVDSAESNEAHGVSSRRLKKREIDRRCQRQARERTKSRIAYLEGLVEDFRRQDASGQVATLMKQLQEVESERDVMAKALKDIQKAMDTHKPLKPTGEAASVQVGPTRFQDAEVVERKPSIGSLQGLDDAPLSFKPEPVDIPDPNHAQFDLANFTSTHHGQRLLPTDMLFAPEIVRLDSDSPQSATQAVVQTKSTDEANPMPSRWADNWADPRPTCSCHRRHGRGPGPQRTTWQGNYWRFANEVLSERFEWPDEVQPANDAVSDDVPVRALLEGWDAVARRGPLHPSWQILRRIDETLFAECPPTERLAIMRAMHTLLQFHTSSTAERYARLPPWYMRRPSQKIAHSYAIDFFAWPGVRERFIFNEHDYCDNEFWRLFCSSLRILWPYEFRDCYTREIGTGLYKVSPMFDRRLGDIKSWTMGPDIFQRFPELCSDMPSFNTIPGALAAPSSSEVGRPASQVRRPLLAAKGVVVTSPQTAARQTGRVVREEEDDEEEEDEGAETHGEIKPPATAVGGQFVPIQNPHLHAQPLRTSQPPPPPPLSYVVDGNHPPQPQPQHHHHHHHHPHPPPPPDLDPHSYNVADFNPAMALDAFSYGAIGEADFVGVYHAEAAPEGMYADMDFLDERTPNFPGHSAQFVGGRFPPSRSGQV